MSFKVSPGQPLPNTLRWPRTFRRIDARRGGTMQDQTRREAPSVDELWTAGRLLLDSNDDGYVDDVAARIVLDGSPSREVWAALFDLAARVGLETSGLTFPLVTGRPEEGQLPIVVSNGNAEA